MSPMATLRDLNKLNAFVRVTERRSFTKAAQDLKTSPSVLSKRLNDLERTLGFSLLNRSTHGVVLTEAGEGLFKNCLQMLASLDNYVIGTRNQQAGPYGALRVKVSAEYARWIVAPLIAEFIRRYPKLRVELMAEVGIMNSLDDGCDVIIASRKPEGPGFVGREIGHIAHVICASPKYFRKHGKPERPQQLQDHNCLVNSLSAPKKWPFKIGAKEFFVEVRGSFSSNSSDVLTQVALDGVGIIRAPRHSVKTELASGKLEPVFQDATQSNELLRAYFPKSKNLPAKITEFVKFLQTSTRQGSSRLQPIRK
jgi:DNA-binding transcriptional LysR family regulator